MRHYREIAALWQRPRLLVVPTRKFQVRRGSVTNKGTKETSARKSRSVSSMRCPWYRKH